MIKRKNYVNNADLTAAIVAYQKSCRKHTKQGLPEPQMNKYIGECISSICNRLTQGYNFSFGGYCVDQETEALCQRGWLKYNEITIDDKILSIDPITKQLVWSLIHDIYKEEYDGLMFKLDGSTIDALVTPGHKFLTAENGLVKVEDLLVKNHLVTMGNPVENNIEIYSDAFVELVGWFVTEGCIQEYLKRNGKKSFHIRIYQSEKVNSLKCDKIQKCLEIYIGEKIKRYKHKNREGAICFNIKSKYTNDLLIVAPDKILSYDFILNLSQRQKILLIQTMIAGDGTFGGRNKNIPIYYQKDKNHIDSFLFLCTLAGYSTSTNYREGKTIFNDLTKIYTIILSNRKNCYLERVDFHGGKRTVGGDWRNKPKKHQPNISYKGIVWCPVTDYGTAIFRRGKKIYGMGQSYHDEMIDDAIERCIYAVRKFNHRKSTNGAFSYLTTVAVHAKIKRLKDEKKQNAIKHKHFQFMSLDPNYMEGLEPNELSNKVISDYESKGDKKVLTKQQKQYRINALKRKKQK